MNLRDQPIERKLGLLIAFNTALAVAAIALVFSIGTALTRYQGAKEQLDAMADVIGENSRAALAFNDPEGARVILNALRGKMEIQSATLLDANGQVFVEIAFTHGKPGNPTPIELATDLLFPDVLEADHVILDGGNTAGHLRLQAHLSKIWIDLLGSLAMMVLTALGLSASAVYFGLRLHRFLTDPILSLARVSHRVSEEQDYSLRAEKTGNDEIGALVDDFNHMLAEIETRDEALRRERASLGERVKRRTADLTEAMEEAKRANKIKSEFLSTVSHELRTPLTAIAGSIGLVVGGALGKLPDGMRDMLKIADKNSQRLTYLINDLLDMEKLLAGKLYFDSQVQELMPLLTQAMEGNQSYAEQFGVRYVIDQSLDGVLVNVDAQRLQQVLANLLSNAAKFSHDGGQVELSVHCTEHRVRVDVTDHGTGIPADLHARVFQKFFQADASDTRQKGGTGLGLAITRELVEHMGGEVGFESAAGEGARFFFEFPIWNSESSFMQLEPKRPEVQDKLRILVVEDDNEVSRVLSMMLSRAGYAIDVVANGTEALVRCHKGNYAAITLDLKLPDISGLEVIERLRAQLSTVNLPIVVVAAELDEGRRSAPPGLKGVHWLSKPIDQNQLLTVLHSVSARKHSHHPRVLHVEDDTDLHDAVRSMAGEHFDFELATTMREARARVALERFDVVLLDLSMPNESGWDLLPAIRAQQPGARVVVLSASVIDTDASTLVDAVLHKTNLSPRQLVDAMSNQKTPCAATEKPPQVASEILP
jgi:signal transduction histidine kinase/DNA-binding response OmpR family regulator